MWRHSFTLLSLCCFVEWVFTFSGFMEERNYRRKEKKHVCVEYVDVDLLASNATLQHKLIFVSNVNSLMGLPGSTSMCQKAQLPPLLKECCHFCGGVFFSGTNFPT